MSTRAAAWLAWALCVLSLALTVLSLLLLALNLSHSVAHSYYELAPIGHGRRSGRPSQR